MKKVVSVSLGSSSRDHQVNHYFLGEQVIIERRGMDGDVGRMKEVIKELDGQVDAFGLGGMDLYLSVGGDRYLLKDAQEVVNCAEKTPIVDGSGLKNTLERLAVEKIQEEYRLFSGDKQVLLVCALDRFGMAEKISEMNCQVIYGDLIFSLGVPVPLYSLSKLNNLARYALPFVRHLPFKMLYPSGSKVNRSNKFEQYYEWADIICGDFHYIQKYLPAKLKDKIIISNTITSEDKETLRNLGVSKLITTTPSLEGRSFGTNVMEALLVAITGNDKELSSTQYKHLLEELEFSPSVNELQQVSETV